MGRLVSGVFISRSWYWECLCSPSFLLRFPRLRTALIQLVHAHHHQASGVSCSSIVSQVGCVAAIIGLTRITLRQGRRLVLVLGMGLMLAAMVGLVSALLDVDLLLYLVAFLLGAGLAANWYTPFAATDFSQNIACQRFLLCPEYDRYRDGPGVTSGELHILFGATGGKFPFGIIVYAMHAVLHGIGHYSLVWPPSHIGHHAAI